MTTPITRVAIVGAGVIRASWATAFLARGMDVVASDPPPGAEEALRKTVERNGRRCNRSACRPPRRWSACGSSPHRKTPSRAWFVQENGPEWLDVKRDLFRRLDKAAPPDALLASSTSTIMISEFQDACTHHPERVVLGHPFTRRT